MVDDKQEQSFKHWKQRILNWMGTHSPKMELSVTLVAECPNCGAEITIDGKSQPEVRYHNVKRPDIADNKQEHEHSDCHRRTETKCIFGWSEAYCQSGDCKHYKSSGED